MRHARRKAIRAWDEKRTVYAYHPAHRDLDIVSTTNCERYNVNVCKARDLGIVEETRHIVMQCPVHDGVRGVLSDTENMFFVLMGKRPPNTSFA